MRARRRPRAVLAVLAVLAVAATEAVGWMPGSTAAAERTVGDGPLDEILAAADRHKACGLSRDKLAALVLAPTFRESGAPTTQAPSPMTLSRWDTQEALYSFGDPSSYRNAFWHPGVGPWQWDDASLQGLTAAQRIDSAVAADFTASFMATRWCANPSFETVWAPWFACASSACKNVYDEIYRDGKLTSVARDLAVDALGGMEAHTCTNGSPARFTCWYVDPDRATGYRGFTVPTAGPAPITAPFYVYSNSGYEVRHWLSDHTGYGIDIKAWLPLTKDSRSSLVWRSGSELCDLTLRVGDCDPVAPEGFSRAARTVNGTYQPLVGDFDGDGAEDVFWYGAGSSADNVWYGSVSRSVTSQAVTVNGTYEPLVGDFDGDGRHDIVWYRAGSGTDHVWWGRTDRTFVSSTVSVGGTYTPLVGDFHGDGIDDIVWYAPGSGTDWQWRGRASRTFATRELSVNGTYLPLVGEFTGDTPEDVLWYGAGGDPDRLWEGQSGGGFVSLPLSVGGTYEPLVLDADADGTDDIFWYGPGSTPDYLWQKGDGGTFTTKAVPVGGTYIPVVGDWNGDHRADLVWYRPGTASDFLWVRRSGTWISTTIAVDGEFTPVVGNLDGTRGDDILWYRPGSGADAIWHAEP